MKTLNDLFLDELADVYDAEGRIAKALPKLASDATCTDLKAIIKSHIKETEGHKKKIEQVFASFGEKVRSKPCEAMIGLVKEGDEIAKEYKDSPAINAALISALQKVEHYELASYGCLHEWAGLLGDMKAMRLLQDILDEEGAANRALTGLARLKSNAEALDDEDEDEAHAENGGSRKKKAASAKG